MANVDITDNTEDRFVIELNKVRERVKTEFTGLVYLLKARENELLRQLDDLLTSYQAYFEKMEVVDAQKVAIEKLKVSHQNELATSPIKSVIENLISQLNMELRTMKYPTKPSMVTFVCDNTVVLSEFREFGRFVDKVRKCIDYKSKKQPLVSVCSKRRGVDKLSKPCGVATDATTGNIYVADQLGNCVKVFDGSGKFLFKFGGSVDNSEMKRPGGIVISDNRVIVTQHAQSIINSTGCILDHQFNGMFLSAAGGYGSGDLEFGNPSGLAVDESTGDIYICDSDNHRVQIVSKEFEYITQFGKDNLQCPRDVKLGKEHIYVLDGSNPCLHLFNHQMVLKKSIITRKQVTTPSFFHLDDSENVLISDYFSNTVNIYDPNFELIHKISVSNMPLGVTVDIRGRVIVVCESEKNCLQIF